jgi:hypothetical protein
MALMSHCSKYHWTRRGIAAGISTTTKPCDGARMGARSRSSPIKNADGRIVGASKIARDITERRRAQTCAGTAAASHRQDQASNRVECERLQGAPFNRVKLCWREAGGPSVKPPEHKGFGSLLLERALEGGLGVARLDYAPQSLICTLEVAL